MTLSTATAESLADVLDIDDVYVIHSARRGQQVQAVSGVSLTLRRGETLGLVGESGCGKSSLARAIMQLPPPTSGAIRLNAVDLTGVSERELRRLRPSFQMIFQDPISSLNPRRPAWQIIAEPLTVARGKAAASRERIREVLQAVGLDPDQVWDRKPTQLSGGQCQRLCIGRALALGPEVLVCDEPVSALDVSIQAQILNVLQDARRDYRISMLFISHDLAVVNNVSDRVAVMYLGRLCEIAPPQVLTRRAAHPYSRLLVDSVPTVDEAPGAVAEDDGGEPPSPLNPPSGCRFRTRCPRATDICAQEQPALVEIAPGHAVACHHPIVDSSPVPS